MEASTTAEGDTSDRGASSADSDVIDLSETPGEIADSNEDPGVGRPPFAQGDLGTIQGILFGAQAEQFDDKLRAVETRLQAAIGEMRAGIGAELAASEARSQADLVAARAELRSDLAASEERLAARIDDAVGKLTSALAAEYDGRTAAVMAERDDRTIAISAVATQHHELAAQVDASTSRLEEALTSWQAAAARRSDEIADRVGHLDGRIASDLEETRATLRADLVDRSALAALLQATAEALLGDDEPDAPS